MFGVRFVAGEPERARHFVRFERVQNREDAAQHEDDGEGDRRDFIQTTFVLKRISAAAPASKQYQPNGRKSLCWKYRVKKCDRCIRGDPGQTQPAIASTGPMATPGLNSVGSLEHGRQQDHRRREQERIVAPPPRGRGPIRSPATIDAPEREMPGSSARLCAAPTPDPSSQVTRSKRFFVALLRRTLTAAQPLAGEHDQALTIKKIATESASRTIRAPLVERARRECRPESFRYEQPTDTFVGLAARGGRARFSDERPHDAHPFVAIVDDSASAVPSATRRRKPETIRSLRRRPMQQRRYRAPLAETLNRKEFADALQDRQQHRLREVTLMLAIAQSP